MSLNQSRSDKNDSQFRKPGGGRGSSAGSGGQHRPFSGGRGRGGAGPTPNTAAPNSNTRSYKKVNNAQGGQSRENPGTVNISDPNTASGPRFGENGGHLQPTLHGISGVSTTPSQGTINKPADAPSQKSGRPIPRAPSSHSPSNSETPLPSAPLKGDGAIQFGSISPGFMNVIQVPPRTSSAPPKLDEQQRDQARRDVSRPVPAVPLPSGPKQDLPKKTALLLEKPVTQPTHTESKAQREAQVASASPPTQAQKPSVLPMTGISLPLPFHQPPVSMSFGGPNPQIQSQSMQNSSLHPMQMPLQVGNPSQVPQQVYMPSLQHPLMQTQGIIHQGQNLGYNPQVASQLPHQLGNMGMNMSTQFNQQPAGKFGSGQYGSSRKTVKITHPETHEELRLDGRDVASSGSRAQHNVPQNQSLPTYTAAHPMGYYPSTYNAGPPYFPVQSSLPLTNTQSTSSSQGLRISYPPTQSNVTVANQPTSKTVSSGKSGTSVLGTGDTSNAVNIRDVQRVTPPAQPSSTPVTVRAVGEKAISSNAAGKLETSKIVNAVKKDPLGNLQSDSGVGRLNQSTSIPISVVETPISVVETSISTVLPSIPDKSTRESSSATAHMEAMNKVTVPISAGDIPKLQGDKGNFLPAQQVDGESGKKVLMDLGDSSKTAASELTQAEIICSSSGLKDSESQAVCVSSVAPDVASSDPVAVGSGNLAHASESFEKSNDGNNSGMDHDVKQINLHSEGNVSKELSAIEERVEQERQGGVLTDPSMVLDANKGDEQVDFSEKAGLLSSVMDLETSQREGNPGTIVNEGDNMQNRSTLSDDSSNVSDGCGIADLNPSSGVMDSHSAQEFDISKTDTSDTDKLPVSGNVLEPNAGHDMETVDNPRPSSSGGSSTASLESNKSKNRGKKKWKELLQKADALGTTADLYMAYKGPEERKEAVAASEVVAEDNLMEIDSELPERIGEKSDEPSKVELDDWEDAADVSTPKLKSSSKDVCGRFIHDEEAATTKKYSRDFLLTFSEQCTFLPEDFQVKPDLAESLMSGNVSSSRVVSDYPSPGRIVDRAGGAARHDRRGNGTMDADRWNKQPGPFPPAVDPRLDLSYGRGAIGFSAVRGPMGVLRHPQAPGPGQPVGGILSGPVHSMGFQGLQRNSSDADRWQRGTNFNKGLMPAPHTPAVPMHKAERKYEVGKVTDEEQAKQRKLKGILNKLTPQNFEKLFEQVKEVNIDNVITLTGVISQIFDKALMEPTFCEMYATFCSHLAAGLPDLSVDNEKITFRRLLLNKCQEEFERGEREELEANADGEGDTELSEAEREEKRIKVRRRMLGNIRLIGELYKKKMLTERIMHECIKKLLGQYQSPDEENIEALCKLMSTIGEMIDHAKAKEHMDAYFDIMKQLSNNMKLSSRVRFMLKDSIDLRKNKWQQRRKVEGPKKIEEVHRDAAQERQGVTARLSRGPSMNSSMRRGQPLDFAPRGSMLSSPIGAGVGFRGMPQVRGFGQEMRIDERNIFESRTPLSVPLPQRSSPDEPITLGPQGGLARGMAFRGQPSVPSSPLLDNSQPYGDPRRMGGGINGYGTGPERGAYSSREDQLMRNTSDRFGASVVHDQFGSSRELRYPDRNVDRSRPITPPVARTGAAPAQNNSSEKVWPEERLRDMSMAAIKEYYSAKDVKEVALCIKDLNAPSFYPTVVSTWVSDSFERKDLQRNMLAELLVDLTKPGDSTFSPSHLIQGFDSVLTDLEDTVTDAPKAPEFLGGFFAKVVLENVLPLKEVGQLIHRGGEEPGRLLEVGLAAEVLGNLLEKIKFEKGEPMLKQILASSNLQLLDFRPPEPIRCPKLEMFM